MNKFKSFLQHFLESKTNPIPFGHGKFNRMPLSLFSIPKYMGKLIDISHSLSQKALHSIFWRRMKIGKFSAAGRLNQIDMDIDRSKTAENRDIYLKDFTLSKKSAGFC